MLFLYINTFIYMHICNTNNKKTIETIHGRRRAWRERKGQQRGEKDMTRD